MKSLAGIAPSLECKALQLTLSQNPGMDFPTLIAGLWLAQSVPACWAVRGLIALTCFWSTKRWDLARQPVSLCLFSSCPCRSSGPALPPKQLRYVAACWSIPPLPAWLPWRPARTLSLMNYGTQMSSYQTGEINLHSSISPLKVARERWRIPSLGGSSRINVGCSADVTPSEVKNLQVILSLLSSCITNCPFQKERKRSWSYRIFRVLILPIQFCCSTEGVLDCIRKDCMHIACVCRVWVWVWIAQSTTGLMSLCEISV